MRRSKVSSAVGDARVACGERRELFETPGNEDDEAWLDGGSHSPAKRGPRRAAAQMETTAGDNQEVIFGDAVCAGKVADGGGRQTLAPPGWCNNVYLS
jgi:hypothetical protein